MSRLSNSIRRKSRVRYKLKCVSGFKCRLSIFKSNKHIFAQLIDDKVGSTLASVSTFSKKFGKMVVNVSTASKLGEIIAKDAISKGVEEVVFDRGRYKYHGCVKAFADSAREAGLRF